jgi:rhodanese-related sulfurtransferase
LEFECRDNDFLASILDEETPLEFDEFSNRKPVIDAAIDDESNSELVCGLIKGDGALKTESIEIRKDELKQFFEDHRNSVIIDVREPHEFSFAQDWSELGLDSPPENIPLTRLSGYLPSLIRSHRETAQDVIFLCRSGKRSGKAAEVARRVGIPARHIAGGIALNVQSRCSSERFVEPGYVI